VSPPALHFRGARYGCERRSGAGDYVPRGRMAITWGRDSPSQVGVVTGPTGSTVPKVPTVPFAGARGSVSCRALRLVPVPLTPPFGDAPFLDTGHFAVPQCGVKDRAVCRVTAAINRPLHRVAARPPLSWRSLRSWRSPDHAPGCGCSRRPSRCGGSARSRAKSGGRFAPADTPE